MATCEIITIGNEILIGQIVDTNSAYIGEKLNEIGVAVNSITSIMDCAKDIESQLSLSIERSDIVIVTGGLGPTKDDMTKASLCKIFNTHLERDNETFEHVKEMVEKRGFLFSESNKAQADVPKCAKVIKNLYGTAPGLIFEKNGHLMFCLPGVPFEMKELLNELMTIVKQKFTLKSVVHKTLLVYGLPESILSETLSEWEDALPDFLHLAYLPNPRGIRLRLSAYDVEKGVAQKEIDAQFAILQTIIPTNVVGVAPTSIEESVAEIMTSKGLTLSVAESCTGGNIANRITVNAGASAFFSGSVVSYSNEVKINVLGVNSCDIEKYGAVSEQVVSQMACGVKKIMKTHYAIATSGVAGPSGGSDEKPVGTVWFALAHPRGVVTAKMRFDKLREQNIERASSYALNMLRMKLLEQI